MTAGINTVEEGHVAGECNRRINRFCFQATAAKLGKTDSVRMAAGRQSVGTESVSQDEEYFFIHGSTFPPAYRRTFILCIGPDERGVSIS